MNGQLWWYVARSGGIVAWALLAGSVLWGLALSTRALGRRPRPNWLLDLHRFLGGLALTFVGVHVLALVLDNYFVFGPIQILVPFTSEYRPQAVAWGVVGLYLLLAVELTSLLRSRLPKRVWRRTHVLSFPLFAVATAHGLLAGTDAGGRLLFTVMLVTATVVAGFTALRVVQALAPRPARPERRSPPPAARWPAPPAPVARASISTGVER